MPKRVRALARNALDARQNGLSDPVTVTFTETGVRRGPMGAASLSRHLQACLDRANEDAGPDMAEVYTRALSVVGQRDIPSMSCTFLIGNRERFRHQTLTASFDLHTKFRL